MEIYTHRGRAKNHGKQATSILTLKIALKNFWLGTTMIWQCLKSMPCTTFKSISIMSNLRLWWLKKSIQKHWKLLEISLVPSGYPIPGWHWPGCTNTLWFHKRFVWSVLAILNLLELVFKSIVLIIVHISWCVVLSKEVWQIYTAVLNLNIVFWVLMAYQWLDLKMQSVQGLHYGQHKLTK